MTANNNCEITLVFPLNKMGINPVDLKLLNEQAIQKVLQTTQNTSNCFKNMNKPKKCSNCSILLTTENYKPDRSVFKNCYITNTLKLMKKRIGLLEENRCCKQDSSSNQNISGIQNSSSKEDVSSHQGRSRKQNFSRKQGSSINQDSSNKQDISS